ncbi:hypothetical protein [Xanthomonas fragariae]|nr:hypothetical protein [Xanthomonas fragariae]WAT15089.1 hypothetical protein OZ429_00490 [Xanthomonas fragariae]
MLVAADLRRLTAARGILDHIHHNVPVPSANAAPAPLSKLA